MTAVEGSGIVGVSSTARQPSLPQATAMMFLGALHARHMLGHVLGAHAPTLEPEFPQALVDLLWSGIAPSTGRDPSAS